MAGFRKDNSDGSQLSPIAVIILLLLAGSVGFGSECLVRSTKTPFGIVMYYFEQQY
jgi:hypothetical protein